MGSAPEIPGQEGPQQDQSTVEDGQIPRTIYNAGIIENLDMLELARRWLEELTTPALGGRG
jgi:hypothetical protein